MFDTLRHFSRSLKSPALCPEKRRWCHIDDADGVDGAITGRMESLASARGRTLFSHLVDLIIFLKQ